VVSGDMSKIVSPVVTTFAISFSMLILMGCSVVTTIDDAYTFFMTYPDRNLAQDVIDNHLNSKMLIELGYQMRRDMVENVIDASTIVLKSGQVVKYLDIEVPEDITVDALIDCHGHELASRVGKWAEIRNTYLVDGRRVFIYSHPDDQDNDSNIRAYVYTQNDFINGHLALHGYAFARSNGLRGPLFRSLVDMQQSAEMERLGLWTLCSAR